ncbi:hypothetical protein HCN44_003431 [Aphidius gifuensis]|uniref:UBP-type domain-containing protein n=1 Tax=Aphidius gifuensis TaxID=684658 RepID=A0A834XIA0_APHGI|nr:hypothetical protein HCN44_003431 [Aphidius gifuensis]
MESPNGLFISLKTFLVFSRDFVKYDETYEIIILPNFTSMIYPSVDLPEQIIKSITGILEAESAIKIAEREALAGTWDGKARIITKHATTLRQLNNGKKIPPSNWKCEKCDLTQNLWLNLTDGSILCGRKFFNGTGGTITKKGNGDVYSYDENDMVDDPNLIIHLSH